MIRKPGNGIQGKDSNQIKNCNECSDTGTNINLIIQHVAEITFLQSVIVYRRQG
jgi:hypothetical protein